MTTAVQPEAIVSELEDLLSVARSAGGDPEALAAIAVQLRTLTNKTGREYLGISQAAGPMLDRLRDLAPLRKAAEEERAIASRALEIAQGQLDQAISDEREILDERITLVCGLHRIEVPITHIAKAAGLTRPRVYRIVGDTKSHPANCPCRS